MHDLNGGIHPNGLFWTVAVPRSSFSLNVHAGRAHFRVRGVPLTESFVFGGPNVVPATADVEVVWSAVGPPVGLGFGNSVPPTDPGAFVGQFARARAVGQFSGAILGFEFSSLPGASSDEGFAELGVGRNGVFI